MEWGYFTTKPILDIETIYKICACDLLRRSIFYSQPFRKFSGFFIASNPICYTVRRKVDKSVIFVSVICHRRSDTNCLIIFFSVHLQTFDFEIFFCLDFYRNNFLSIINQQINFATAPLWSF